MAPTGADDDEGTMLDRFRILAGGLDHPEGVAWSPDGSLYAGGEAGQIYRVGLDGSVARAADTGGFILGVAVDGAGRVYACDVANARIARIDVSTGAVEDYARGSAEQDMAAPNWLAFDETGNLFVTDSGDWGKRNGLVWRVRPGGAGMVWSTEPDRLPNGCCLSRDGDALLVVETNLPGVSRIPILADGSAGRREVFVELPGMVPDGIAATADGGYVVTLYRPDGLALITPTGEVETLAADPDGQLFGGPSNVAFCGPALDLLAVANLGRWHLAIGDAGIRGAPLRYPEIA